MPARLGQSGECITVMLVDDHQMVAEGLAAALDNQPDIEVVAVNQTIAGALESASALSPQVVLLDYRMPDGDSVEAVRQIRRAVPGVSVVMITAVTGDRIMTDAMAAGCLGFVSKSESLETLVRVVRTVARGEEAVVGSRISPPYMYSSVGERGLTARETDVLRAMASGQSSASIAQSLGLSEHTVRNHMRKLFVKLRAHNKLEAVLLAARAGLVELDE